MAPKSNNPVVTGYYRWTDIWFQWPSALPNRDDERALKAILAHDSIVHPDHPLHPGEEGITMYMGTFPSGESRLLMSSAQIDYCRYWLHSVGKTTQMIALPYSDCLLTPSNLTSISAKLVKTGWDLKNIVKKIEKSNKKLKGKTPGLGRRLQLFDLIRTFWAAKKGVWCAIDIEAWEKSHDVITELGYSFVRWEDGEEVAEHAHLIIEEHKMYTNSVYVQGNRDHYNFGKSEISNKKNFKKRVHGLFDMMLEQGPIFLVFHDHGQDVKYLESRDIEAPVRLGTHILPDNLPEDGIFYVDTSDLFGALVNNGEQKKSLSECCRLLGIPTQFLHNAGNDAYYTMLAFKSMASGAELEAQREQRWPKQAAKFAATNDPEIEFHPWDEDSDYEDMEGLFPAPPAYDRATGQLNTAAE
ncbi:hypothetical protein BDN71DRAFT_1447561 [Pleurotus eryngii]|uniref:Gfd2/YDR514C-like C-terminal domain-containing protein n=1 Tax=Pleurotus eryngii TaxID=5323 RepID=A0A9P6DGP9_PLEER|nr:hypothetical protein BDN71DRAFT_1447561 [Pleurotus eryngii]